MGWDEIRQVLRQRQPRFVGSYVITSTIGTCLELGRIVKQEVPGATYMPRMASFHKYPDAFRRRYMLSSMKLIMKSSFIVKKLGRLSMPAAIQKILDAAKSRDKPKPTPA